MRASLLIFKIKAIKFSWIENKSYPVRGAKYRKQTFTDVCFLHLYQSIIPFFRFTLVH
ncbi:hypothetical protein AYJ16_004496 [Salmonella enterica subsp. enterica serovar Agona]|uniref:Uncharacterized protein n=3 Tax=Salmonella enterica TaxID=28901 RepID=A0A739ED90_SALET|nr:hypothetical protein [Salmonella enterica]EDQ2548461.1 hypothetical protein [Salmonella enterica subsp. enterica]EDQ9204187.1 hypothetical protein [Salmonella enterica subsp. enterica serovar Agona]EDT8709440.1 hypothetical protein [Salmonella enterica subsp. salamae]EDT8882132.1 hypothetical protein [Salmonella enterica subsp. enterica serovar Hato]EDU1251830.1 hypothetical protein [Salmonella enterica subsp. enterica serovar 4,[5],12:i:-]EDU6488084.1 hypothetical protein [Salmonella ente